MGYMDYFVLYVNNLDSRAANLYACSMLILKLCRRIDPYLANLTDN